MKSGNAKVGYRISFFEVLKLKMKHLCLLRMVWVVFLPEVEANTVCVRERSMTISVNVEVVLNNLRERTQTLHFAVFAILGCTVFKSLN